MDGFVPTENLRFREDALVFKVSENASEEDIKRMTRFAEMYFYAFIYPAPLQV